ncbi:BnaC02g24010D [Brassica napus]|uniref:BnaC02g24010D protein n=1 Tax=Brassica napus TaxID=3708 RepID=A0A078G1I2_BRANA|nr:BnaC02g24010D [Brassica napus]
MSDAVLKKGDSNTLSDKELDAAVLPPDQPLNELTSPSYADSNTLSVKELAISISGHKIAFYFYSSTGDPLPEPKPGKRSLYMQSPTPPNLVYRRTYYHTYTPSPTYSPTAPGGYSYSQSQDAMHAKPLLFAKIALHCYNLEKGTHFERLGLPRDYDQTLEARDPARNYTCRFETSVRLATENKDCFHVVTTRCRPLPPPPPPGNMIAKMEDGFQCGFDTLSVDELFKGNMPDWLPDDYATSTQLLLQYYEMKESEVEQAKEWLHLYAELALYTKKQTDPFMFERSKPLELGKVVVQTRGVVDSLKEVELLDNAVFFITFKTSCGGVIYPLKGYIKNWKGELILFLGEFGGGGSERFLSFAHSPYFILSAALPKN